MMYVDSTIDQIGEIINEEMRTSTDWIETARLRVLEELGPKALQMFIWCVI